MPNAFRGVRSATCNRRPEERKPWLPGSLARFRQSELSVSREARIWYNRTVDHGAPEERFENVIVLSDEFFQEVTEHPIPTDLEVVKFLSSAPAVLDLFVWLSYRCFTAKEKEAIPIFGPFGLVQQLGAVEYARPRKFREKLLQWLRPIRLVWPECPATISPGGRYLVVGHATTVRSAVASRQK